MVGVPAKSSFPKGQGPKHAKSHNAFATMTAGRGYVVDCSTCCNAFHSEDADVNMQMDGEGVACLDHSVSGAVILARAGRVLPRLTSFTS